MSRARLRYAAALSALLALAGLPSAALGASPPGYQLSTGATLTASAAQLSGLVYDGTLTVATTAGDVQVLQLTSTSASLTDLQLHVPCTAVPGLGTGMATDATTSAGSTSSAPSGLTLYATSVAATSSAGPVAWTPASPPPTAQLGDVALTGLTVDFAGLEAPSLSLPGLAQATSFC